MAPSPSVTACFRFEATGHVAPGSPHYIDDGKVRSLSFCCGPLSL